LVGDTVTFSAIANDPDNDLIASVEFVCGNQSLGTDNTAPYSLDVSTLPVGTYACLATATDEHGAVGVSQLVVITIGNPVPPPNSAPLVVLTSPPDGTNHLVGDTVTFSAIANDPDNDLIASVEFVCGNQSLGTDVTAPYSLDVSTLPVGTYACLATATDEHGAVGVSQLVVITIGNPVPPPNSAPVVVLTAPPDNASYLVGDTVNFSAIAIDPDNDLIASVEFVCGNQSLGTDVTAPYSLNVSTLPVGTYACLATATDEHGAVGVSQLVVITIGNPVPPPGNHDPGAIILSPANGATGVAPTDMWWMAIPYDVDGDTITSMQFLVNGDTVPFWGTVTNPPLGVPVKIPVKFRAAGSYTLLVEVTDIHGAVGYSQIIVVNISQPPAVALKVCYNSLPPNTYGQGASIDPDDASGTGTGWIPYADLPFDADGCMTVAQIDGRIPYFWAGATNGPRSGNQWYGDSLVPSLILTDGATYSPPFGYPSIVFFDQNNGGGPGVGDGWFICLWPDCGLQTGYGHLLIRLFPDADGDGTPNVSDNCQLYANDQVDSNGDGIGDVCEGRDSDNDAYRDSDDKYPTDPAQH
jgi:hypothetical protein